MEQRRLGASSLSVGVVGLGGNNFGRPGSATATLEGAREVLEAALDVGVTFVDTAEMYGASPGQSEELIGRAIAGRRDEIALATKFGHPEFAMPGLDGMRPGGVRYIRSALVDSLRRLGTDHVELYQQHAPDPSTPLEETIGALQDLVDEGRILTYGVSNYPADRLRAIGAGSVATVQDEYSLLRRDAENGILPRTRELGASFLPYYPLFNGLLTGRFTRNRRPGDSRLARHKPELLDAAPWDLLEEYSAYCASRGVTMLEATFGWLLAQAPVASVIAGATTPAQVRANASAARWRPSEEEVAAISAIFDPARVATTDPATR